MVIRLNNNEIRILKLILFRNHPSLSLNAHLFSAVHLDMHHFLTFVFLILKRPSNCSSQEGKKARKLRAYEPFELAPK